jgi:DNA-binding response OmpR family regulator
MNNASAPQDFTPARASPVGRVLVVEENPQIRNAIVAYLADHQWSAIGTDQRDIPRHLQSRQLSLVTLNARLKMASGLDVLRQIRTRSQVPLIMYKDGQDDEVERVVGLELGADDFMSGALNLHELLARARAILRRQELGRTAPQPTRGGYRFAGCELRHATRDLISPAGTTVALTRSEYGLLCALLGAPGRTLTRLHLMRATRTHEDISDRSIDVQILRLRRKLDKHAEVGKLITTDRSFGYRFAAEAETLY